MGNDMMLNCFDKSPSDEITVQLRFLRTLSRKYYKITSGVQN